MQISIQQGNFCVEVWKVQMWQAAAALHIVRRILIPLDNACLPNYKNRQT